MKYFSKYLIIIILPLLMLIGGGLWFFNSLGEREKPSIRFGEDVKSIGRSNVMGIIFADSKSGLRRISVTLTQDNKTHTLANETLANKGVKEKRLTLSVIPATLQIHDGPATLSVAAVDYSLFKNETVLTRPITVDTTPPRIYLLTSTNNINPGGSCVVAYRTSEPTLVSGVQAGDVFTTGYPGTFAGQQATIVYFGLPMEIPSNGLNIRIVARDGAGNETSVAIPALIRMKGFRRDMMQLSDNFLNRKMPDFQPLPPEIQDKSLIDQFVYVNSVLRTANEIRIKEICQQSVPEQLWQGTFLRMKNASPMARFGDQRTYIYNNKDVGQSIHYGVDLASLTNAPVEAVNNGIVKFAEPLGIYGNAVIIDHGQGIFSVYGHLSSINVQVGQKLKKDDIIGNSGMTGLAGGDHLHLGIVAGGRFVNPIEWWDPHWIADNVTKKLSGS